MSDPLQEPAETPDIMTQGPDVPLAPQDMTQVPRLADAVLKPAKRTRTPSTDKGKVRGKRTAKSTSVKPGPKCARKLYYRLLSPDLVEGLDNALLSTAMVEGLDNELFLGEDLRPLAAVTPSDAVREVLLLSQRDENRDTHIGRPCQIIGLLDKFTIAGKVHVQVKAERC